jgi:hypothetical protein
VVSITKEDLRRLQAKRDRPSPRPGPGDVVVFFAPGILKSKNMILRMKRPGQVRYYAQWREKVSHALLEAGWPVLRRTHDPRRPMTVSFLGRVARPMDDDGLILALASCRDELVDNAVISGDAKSDGHVFEYGYVVDRVWRGVEVRVRPR